MSKEIRQMINKVKNFKEFLNESLEPIKTWGGDKHQFLNNKRLPEIAGAKSPQTVPYPTYEQNSPPTETAEGRWMCPQQ